MLKKLVFIFVVSFVLFTGTALFAGTICNIVEQSIDCVGGGSYPCCTSGLCDDPCFSESYRIIPTIETEKNPASMSPAGRCSSAALSFLPTATT